MTDGQIFLCIVVAPAVVMLLGQVAIRSWHRFMMWRDDRLFRRQFAQVQALVNEADRTRHGRQV